MGEALITRRGGSGGDVIEMIAQGTVRFKSGGMTTTQIESGGYYRGCVDCSRTTYNEKKGCIVWRDSMGGSYSAIVDWENQVVTQIIDDPAYSGTADDFGMNYGYKFSGKYVYLAVSEFDWEESTELSVDYFYEV